MVDDFSATRRSLRARVDCDSGDRSNQISEAAIQKRLEALGIGAVVLLLLLPYCDASLVPLLKRKHVG